MATVARIRTSEPFRVGTLLESLTTIALPATSGALVGMATWNSTFAWVALLPLAITIRHARLRTELCLGLFLGGLAAHLVGLDWMRTAQQGNDEVVGPRVLEWLCSGTLGGLFWIFSFTIGGWFLRTLSAPLAIAFPVVWVAHEFVWKNGFALIDGVGFPWLQLGATQIDRLWLVQLADVAGVWGVTAIVASVNGALADVVLATTTHLAARAAALAGVSVASAAVLGSAVYGQWRLSQPVPESGPIPALMPAEVQATRKNINQLGPAAARADFVLWSECAHSSIDECEQGDCVAEIAEIAGSLGTTLIVTCDRDCGKSQRRSMIAFGSDDEGATYDKHKLVAWNEFTPWLTIPGVTKSGGRFEPGQAWPVFRFGGAQNRSWCAAGLICYDACFPEVSRGHLQGSAQPDFFVVSADEASDATMSLQKQILGLSRFRAIECRRSVVRNAYGGYSGVIDGCGRLREVVPDRVLYEPWIGKPVPIDNRQTVYARWGDWLPLMSVALILMTGASRATSRVGRRGRVPGLKHFWSTPGLSAAMVAKARPRSNRRHARGFTIIELLVVLALIGLLLGLVAAAVGAARESSRRSSCQHNLRQIGIALQAYQASWGSLPPALIWFPSGEPLGGGEIPIGVIDRVARYGQVGEDRIRANWAISLLPQLEQAALFQQFDPRVPLAHQRNAQIRAARLAIMLCPSDSYNGKENAYARGGAAGLADNLYARGNYAINVGPDANCVSPGTPEEPCQGGFFVDSLDLTRHSQVWGSGIAGVNKVFKSADISDGLSNTVAIDEIRAGLDSLDPRGTWALGQVGASVIVRHGQFSNTTGPNSCDYDSDEIIGCAALKQKLGPQRLRGECMDCNDSSLASEINAKSTARSLHNAGVNVMMCDSSARFIADSVDSRIWHALHTRNRKDLNTSIAD